MTLFFLIVWLKANEYGPLGIILWIQVWYMNGAVNKPRGCRT